MKDREAVERYVLSFKRERGWRQRGLKEKSVAETDREEQG